MDVVTDSPADSPMWRLLRAGAVLEGLATGQAVTVLAAERLTEESANVAYRTDTGIVETIVYAEGLSRVREFRPGSAPSCSAVLTTPVFSTLSE